MHARKIIRKSSYRDLRRLLKITLFLRKIIIFLKKFRDFKTLQEVLKTLK